MSSYAQPKETKIKEKQDKFLRAQLEKEREQQLLEEIERTEKERIKKKGLKTLKQSGILDSYQDLLTSLCKYGLPTGDLYEFSALTVLKYEKKVKAQRKRELEDRMKQRNETKVRDRSPDLNNMHGKSSALEESKEGEGNKPPRVSNIRKVQPTGVAKTSPRTSKAPKAEKPAPEVEKAPEEQPENQNESAPQ